MLKDIAQRIKTIAEKTQTPKITSMVEYHTNDAYKLFRLMSRVGFTPKPRQLVPTAVRWEVPTERFAQEYL